MPTFESEIKRIIQPDGYWGMVIEDLKDDKTLFELNPDHTFFAASTNKVPIAIALLLAVEKGEMDLSWRMTLESQFKREGSGILKDLPDGLSLRIDDLVRLVLVMSDNTATKILVDKLTPQKINSVLQALGVKVTQLEVLPDGGFYLGNTTPREMADLLNKVYKGEVLSKEHTDYLLKIMATCQFDLGITRLKPKSKQLPVVHKQGTYEDNRHEIGIILGKHPILFSIYSEKLTDEVIRPDNKGLLILAEIGQQLYQYLESD